MSRLNIETSINPKRRQQMSNQHGVTFHAAVMFCRNLKSPKGSSSGYRLLLGGSTWCGCRGNGVTSLKYCCIYCRIHIVQPSGHYMYRTVVTIYNTSLTFNNSTFCPHSVFVYFVWI